MAVPVNLRQEPRWIQITSSLMSANEMRGIRSVHGQLRSCPQRKHFSHDVTLTSSSSSSSSSSTDTPPPYRHITDTSQYHSTHGKHLRKQRVALTGRNTTGPPCGVGGPTAHAPGRRRADCPRARRPASAPAGSVTDSTDNRRDDRRQPAKRYWLIKRASNNLLIPTILLAL